MCFDELVSIHLSYTFQSFKIPSLFELILLFVGTIFCAAFTFQGVAWDRPDTHGYIYFERPQATTGEDCRAAVHSSTRDVGALIDTLDKDLVVFWGSQSGTAEGLAQRLSRDLHRRFGLNILTADLSDHDPASLGTISASKLAVFILSTYGEGGPSDNAIQFWNWITSSDDDRNLSNLRFMAFGLGNSNYKHYNKVVDVVEGKLQLAGARVLLPVARADEAAESTEEDYLAWAQDVYNVLQTQLNTKPRAVEYEPTLSIATIPDGSNLEMVPADAPFAGETSRMAHLTSAVKPLPVIASVELLERSGDRHCLCIELDLTNFPELRYKTGDHLAIWPINPADEIDRLLRMLGQLEAADVSLYIEPLDSASKLRIPKLTTLRILLCRHLDICGPVSRNTAAELSHFAPSPEAKIFLRRLGGDRETFNRFRAERLLTIGSLLEHASGGLAWNDLPLPFLLESIPALQPRYYSISSSSVVSPRRVAVTVMVSNKPLASSLSVTIPGLTTNYLLSLSKTLSSPPLAPPLVAVPCYIQAQIRRTKFKPPVSTATPMIMIANGTGIAPFRAFILERAKLHSVGRAVGKMILFFGCRCPNMDFLYRDVLEAAQQNLQRCGGTDSSPLPQENKLEGLLSIKTAFSRVQGATGDNLDDAKLKGYVQDAVEKEIRTVISMLNEQGASLYICGGAAMAREVRKRVTSGYELVSNASANEGVEWLEGLRSKGKWKEDVWE